LREPTINRQTTESLAYKSGHKFAIVYSLVPKEKKTTKEGMKLFPKLMCRLVISRTSSHYPTENVVINVI
jgi:hypothetical protein